MFEDVIPEPSRISSYIDPRILSSLAIEVEIQFERSIQTDDVVQRFLDKTYDESVSIDVDILAFLAPAVRNFEAVYMYNSTSLSRTRPPSPSSQYFKLLIFGIAINFAGMSEVTRQEVWKFLKSSFGIRLPRLFSLLLSHSSRAIAQQLFQCALEAGDADAVELFLESRQFLINANDLVCRHSDGLRYTAVEFSAMRRDLRITKLLLEHGANVNRTVDQDKHRLDCNRALHCALDGPGKSAILGEMATEPELLELVKLLLQWGARVSSELFLRSTFRFRDPNGEIFELLINSSTLHDLRKWSKSSIFQDLLEHKEISDSAVCRILHPILQDSIITQALKGPQVPNLYLLDVAISRVMPNSFVASYANTNLLYLRMRCVWLSKLETRISYLLLSYTKKSPKSFLKASS